MAVVAVPFILYLVRFCSPKPLPSETCGSSMYVCRMEYPVDDDRYRAEDEKAASGYGNFSKQFVASRLD